MIVDQRCFGDYLAGTLTEPDSLLHPKAAQNWRNNNCALRAFILEHISDHDYNNANIHTNVHTVYETLRKSHLFQGLQAQVNVFKEALDTQFAPTTPLNWTLDQITKLHSKFTKMGKIDEDQLLIILILNALGNHYVQLQISINNMLQNSATTSVDVWNRIVREEQTIISHKKQAASDPTALAASASKNNRPVCTNCKCSTHHTKFCISPGGQMASNTIEEARTTQDATHNKSRATSKPCNNRGTVSPSVPNDNSDTKTISINGKCYMLVSDKNAGATTTDGSKALSAVTIPAYDKSEYITALATSDDACTSVNWDLHPPHTANTTAPVMHSTGHCPLTCVDDMLFILDTGATCHISPEASDFKTLHSIPRHPIKGLSVSAIYAVEIGEIDLHIASSHTLKLTNVLYIPDSSVCLVSIVALNSSGNYTTHFNSNKCWVTNKSNTILICGSLSSSKRLYTLTTATPSVLCGTQTPTTHSVHYAKVPDLETWHHRLGHCNTRTIIDMAKNGITQGMPIDLSLLPPTCDHCVLGKQSHASIPKVRENCKATGHLERVYMDLCGPMAVPSCSGNVYSINIIDEFSGYVWSIPLRSKAAACAAL